MNDLNEKKIFIYKNINKIHYHNEIINYILNNDIKYTENNNGFFINISLMDDHINNIYDILKYNLLNDDDNDGLINEKHKMELINCNHIINKYGINNKNNNNIKLNIFKNFEKKIIKDSKKHQIN